MARYIKVHCDSCAMLAINGIACHEIGCPDAWKDHTRECKECGAEFAPEDRRQTCCSQHCAAMYGGWECDCEDCVAMAMEEA